LNVLCFKDSFFFVFGLGFGAVDTSASGFGGCGGGLTGAGLTTDSLVTAGFSGTFDFTTGFSGAGALASPLPKAGIETRLTLTADGMYLLEGVSAGMMMNIVIRTMWSSNDIPI
jgi:hypothetical protein